jgi:hypothetical protein
VRDGDTLQHEMVLSGDMRGWRVQYGKQVASIFGTDIAIPQ